MRERAAHGDANSHTDGDCQPYAVADSGVDGDANPILGASLKEAVCAHPAPYGDCRSLALSDSDAHAHADSDTQAHPDTPSPTPSAREQAIAQVLWANQWEADTLRDLAIETPMTVDAFLEWIGDGVQRGDGSKYILSEYAALADSDEQMVLRILGMPFLEEVEWPDSAVLRLLRGLLPRDEETFAWLLAHPTLVGGITDAQAADVFLLRLERKDAAAACAIRRLPWVRDGVEIGGRSEDRRVIQLVEIALDLPQSFRALTERAWVQDGIWGREGDVLIDVAGAISSTDEEVAHLIGMPFLDAVDRTDAELVGKLLVALRPQPHFVTQTAARPELEGGITDAQRATVALSILELYDREDANALRELPWLWDGPQPVEEDAFWILWDTAHSLQVGELFRLLLSKPWARDDLTPVEAQVVVTLTRMFRNNYWSPSLDISAEDSSADFSRIMGMQFLETIDEADVAIVRALTSQPASNRGRVLSRPSLAGGITDDFPVAILELLVLARRDPDLAANLRALPWIQDGIDGSEGELASVLIEVVREHPAILDLPWIQDGADPTEAEAVRTLVAGAAP